MNKSRSGKRKISEKELRRLVGGRSSGRYTPKKHVTFSRFKVK